MIVRPEVHVSLRDSSNPNFKIFKADTSKVEAAKRITNKCRSSKEIRPAPQLQGKVSKELCRDVYRHLTETRVQKVIYTRRNSNS